MYVNAIDCLPIEQPVFFFFRPAGTTRCADQGKIGQMHESLTPFQRTVVGLKFVAKWRHSFDRDERDFLTL